MSKYIVTLEYIYGKSSTFEYDDLSDAIMRAQIFYQKRSDLVKVSVTDSEDDVEYAVIKREVTKEMLFNAKTCIQEDVLDSINNAANYLESFSEYVELLYTINNKLKNDCPLLDLDCAKEFNICAKRIKDAMSILDKVVTDTAEHG